MLAAYSAAYHLRPALYALLRVSSSDERVRKYLICLRSVRGSSRRLDVLQRDGPFPPLAFGGGWRQGEDEGVTTNDTFYNSVPAFHTFYYLAFY